jgi:probable HAF family extracellular repeat protein
MKGLSKSGWSARCVVCAILTVAAGASNGGQQTPGSAEGTPRYTIVDLGVVGGAPAQPYGMADNDLIAGGIVTASNAVHAVWWHDAKPIDIGSPGLGGINSLATGVNKWGTVVGAAQRQRPDFNGGAQPQPEDFNAEDFCGFNAFGLAESNTACKPFVWNHGRMRTLPTLGGANGYASMINTQGQVSGYAETRHHERGCAVNHFLPVVWTNGEVDKLPLIKGDSDGVAAWINDKGQAVGATGSCGAFNTNSQLYLVEEHAVLWENGQATDLGNLGGDGAGAGNHACSVNNLGQVVGHSNLPNDVTFHGFLWTREKHMQDLGTLDSDPASLGLGINDAGFVVGASLDAEFTPRAFVWNDGVMTDLNTLVSGGPSLYLLMAYDVNNRGDIDGLAVSSDGQLHGFLAIPSQVSDKDTMSGNNEPRRRPTLTEDAHRLLKQQLAHRHHIGGWQ